MAPGLWQSHANVTGPRHGQSRVFITPQAEEHLLRNGVRTPMDQFLGLRLALWSNLHLLDGIPKVNGSSTLQIREQMQLQKRLYDCTNALPEGLLDFLGVSHLSSSENLVEWSPRTNYCPFVTGGQKPEFANAPEAIRRLLDDSFDPRKTVFFDEEPGCNIGVSGATSVTITNLKVESHAIDFDATAGALCVCVISQSYYHCSNTFIY